MTRRHEGVALVAILLGILLLSIIVGGVVGLTRTENKLLEFEEADARSNASVDAALTTIVKRLSESDPPQQSRLSDRSRINARGESPVTAFIEFESGRIDLNAADDELLRALFESAGASNEDARRWVAELRDWQDADDERRIDGAEARDYRSEGLPYGPRNGKLKSVPELSLLAGMPDTIVQCILDRATVYTQEAAPDLIHLGPGAQRAWTRYLANQNKEVPMPSQAGETTHAASGQVLRLHLIIQSSENIETRWAIVGRLTGDNRDPWKTLARFREGPQNVASGCDRQ